MGAYPAAQRLCQLARPRNSNRYIQIHSGVRFCRQRPWMQQSLEHVVPNPFLRGAGRHGSDRRLDVASAATFPSNACRLDSRRPRRSSFDRSLSGGESPFQCIPRGLHRSTEIRVSHNPVDDQQGPALVRRQRLFVAVDRRCVEVIYAGHDEFPKRPSPSSRVISRITLPSRSARSGLQRL